MKFGYTAIDAAGDEVPGVVETDSLEAAVSKLRAMGLYPTNIFIWATGPCVCRLEEGREQYEGALKIDERDGRKALCFQASLGVETIIPLSEIASYKLKGLFNKKLHLQMASGRHLVFGGDLGDMGKTVGLAIDLTGANCRS